MGTTRTPRSWAALVRPPHRRRRTLVADPGRVEGAVDSMPTRRTDRRASSSGAGRGPDRAASREYSRSLLVIGLMPGCVADLVAPGPRRMPDHAVERHDGDGQEEGLRGRAARRSTVASASDKQRSKPGLSSHRRPGRGMVRSAPRLRLEQMFYTGPPPLRTPRGSHRGRDPVRRTPQQTNFCSSMAPALGRPWNGPSRWD